MWHGAKLRGSNLPQHHLKRQKACPIPEHFWDLPSQTAAPERQMGTKVTHHTGASTEEQTRVTQMERGV